MRRLTLPAVLLASVSLAACSHKWRPPEIAYDDVVATPAATAAPTIAEPEPPRAVEIVEVPTLLPLPGQLMPIPSSRTLSEPADPRARVAAANSEARVQPSRAGYVNAVQVYPFWSYPQDELLALRSQNTAAAAAADQQAPASSLPPLESLNFRYRIEGDRPAWRPVRAFDDGRQVYVEFPAGIAQGEMPPLWIIGSGGEAELVNYRVRSRFIVVDRLFGGAELRLGGKRQQRVRIVRTDRKPAS